MYKPLPPITEALEELETQLRRTRDPQRRQGLHLLVLLQRGDVQSRQEAAAHLAVHRNTVRRWLSAYQRGGLEELLRIDTPGAKAEQRTLSPAVLEALQERLAREGFSSGGLLQLWRGPRLAGQGARRGCAVLHAAQAGARALGRETQACTAKRARPSVHGQACTAKRARPVHAKKPSPTSRPSTSRPSPRGSAASSMRP